jgi:hypothetical protein
MMNTGIVPKSQRLKEFDNVRDAEGIALLRQIFPEESTDELVRLHRHRLTADPARRRLIGSSQAKMLCQSQHPDGKLNSSPMSQSTDGSGDLNAGFCLPRGFLELPPSFAVRRIHSITGRSHYEMVAELEQAALLQHHRLSEGYMLGSYYTRVLFRDSKVGLGLSLYSDENGCIRIHALTSHDGRQWDVDPADLDLEAPWVGLGIEKGDIIFGVNGVALVESTTPAQSKLQHLVQAIHLSSVPTVIHLLRQIRDTNIDSQSPPTYVTIRSTHQTPSLLDTTLTLDTSLDSHSVDNYEDECVFHSTPLMDGHDPKSIHPFISLLALRGIVTSEAEQRACSVALHEFHHRVRHWEATSSFRLEGSQPGSDILIPLMGVRQALSVRIVHTFLDGRYTAFTIWAFDVASGIEWYAPVRYYSDFCDLRAALMQIQPLISAIPFPKSGSTLFGTPPKPDTATERDCKARQLEAFLRTLCGYIYREELHCSTAEVAIHLQSFLGCENEHLLEPRAMSVSRTETEASRIRRQLKLSLQRYVYRLFLLRPMNDAVELFIDTVRARGPRLPEIEALEAQGRSVLKGRAMKDLEQVQTFLDYLQDIIMDSCMQDFNSIAERPEYAVLHPYIMSNSGATFWDRLIREAVREQVEIEVYVPLRSLVSRWIVSGWRHEDMEVQFKIRELRKRPPGYFKISKSQNVLNWLPVFNILKEGVGQSTLPCAKLRAIVEAARELSVLYHSQNSSEAEDDLNIQDMQHIGADDFLPMFIFCVVQAEMDRPCALCVLLRTLCDRINRIGEIGYFLASFEAAITHIQELDLAEEGDEMLSFLSVPLSDG